MSSKALNWAFAQDITPAARKLVLVSMADGADEYGVYWSGYTTLSDKTSIDRRTVIRHVESLMADGLIEKVRRFKDNGGDRTNLYRLNLGGVISEDHPMQNDLIEGGGKLPPPPRVAECHPPGGELPRPEPSLEPINKKTALTRQEFLREIDQERLAGRFERFTGAEGIIETEAGDCWDYWQAYPEKKPSGDPVAAFIGWLRQSKALATVQKLAEKSKVAAGGEVLPEPSNPIQPWHEKIQKMVAPGVFRAWFRVMHFDQGAYTISVPTAFHAGFIKQHLAQELNAVLPGVKIIVQPKTETKEHDQCTA